MLKSIKILLHKPPTYFKRNTTVRGGVNANGDWMQIRRKAETPEKTEVRLKLYADELILSIDKTSCIKCDICSIVCPQNAIWVESSPDGIPDICIDPQLCVLCEVCSHFCPVSCIELKWNNAPKKILESQHALANFPEKISVDRRCCPEGCSPVNELDNRWCRRDRKWIENLHELCPKYCHHCLESCPRTVYTLLEDEIVFDTEQCLRCMTCTLFCEYGAIKIEPVFEGKITLDDSKCPSDCMKCIDVCPVSCIERDGERVFLKYDKCAFCGACVNVCDQDAILLERFNVRSEEGDFCELWEKAKDNLKKPRGNLYQSS